MSQSPKHASASMFEKHKRLTILANGALGSMWELSMQYSKLHPKNEKKHVF
jgi:hypothetical protein